MCGQIGKIIMDIQTEGRTVILVEQNARLALALSQHAYVIETGDIALSGPAKELRENDDVKKAYLGG
jgi:branched-chain amino acid transport system ATP-binding protein